MKKRRLGINGPEVSAIGLGCMGMSEFYGASDDIQSKQLIREALKEGVTMLDTADMYGHGHNEMLIAEALKGWSGDVFIATKFGICRKKGSYERTINGRPEYVKSSAEDSLRRLGREVIDLYYIHRVDTAVPIEDTVGAMADLVREGKVRYIGISEASEATIRRAHAVHPLTAVQSEYSLWTRRVEQLTLPVTRELGIGFVAYSPLGRGFLTGAITTMETLDPGDFRKFTPRFQGDNFSHNRRLVQEVEAIAHRRSVTTAQLVLAWLLSKGDDIIPIPGTRHFPYLRDNIDAVDVALTGDEIEAIETAVPVGAVKGERYPEAGMIGIDG
ncbi:MAG: aldo/keto reductase [Deltaproteobacteria bacterium]|nr:aldo/keto reductase [Deltaproteobacteria bacterium]MBN2688945.1 aldo/keto reductase [Deltaproteobacteria bacterium]